MSENLRPEQFLVSREGRHGAIAAAIADANRSQHDGVGFTIEVAMTDDHSFVGTVIENGEEWAKLRLWDDQGPTDRVVFLSERQVIYASVKR